MAYASFGRFPTARASHSIVELQRPAAGGDLDTSREVLADGGEAVGSLGSTPA
jgi:hypothetical protein